MTIVFRDFLHKLVECYVDDLVVKTKDRENHPHDLRKVFEKLRQHQLKMNPLKMCIWGHLREISRLCGSERRD